MLGVELEFCILEFAKKNEMKKFYILLAAFCVTLSNPSVAMNGHDEVRSEIKAGVAITIAVKSSAGKPIKGALIKVIANKMVIAAGSTDESGTAAIKIASYGNQPVDIEISHALFRPTKIVNNGSGPWYTPPRKKSIS